MQRARHTAHAAPAQFLLLFAAARGLDPPGLLERFELDSRRENWRPTTRR